MIRFLRCIVLLLLLALSSYRLAAQENYPQLYLGGKAGGTASFMFFSPTVGQSIQIGPHAGVVCRFISEKYFGLQVELLYIQKGWAQPRTNHYLRQLNYIELPFLSHLTFGKKVFHWFFNLGPNISYLMWDNAISTSSTGEMPNEQILPLKNKFDYGICVGTGFEFYTKAGVYQLEARYDFGLGNLFSSSPTSSIKRSSNQNISLSLGILFPLLKK